MTDSNARGTFDAIPTEEFVDDRKVIYVSAPSLEQVTAIQEIKKMDVTVGARVQALAQARDLHRFTKDEEVPEQIIETARKFTTFLLEG